MAIVPVNREPTAVSHVVEELAQFVHDVRYDDLPDETIVKAKELALHCWGVQLAASTLPWSQQACRFVRRQGGRPTSTVVNYGFRTSAVGAAYLNGVFAHGFEMDDNHARSAVKPGCVVVPSALAVGEDAGRSGEDVIAAIAIGSELMTRIGVMITPAVMDQGGHPTGATGGFGAAAVTARLLRLDERQMAYALAAAGAQRMGLTEIPPSGRGHIKRTFGGAAAAGGVAAAMLASEGMTTPLTNLDAGQGYARAFAVTEEATDELVRDLGRRWEMHNLHYKIYAQDGYIQPMTEAIRQLRQTRRFTADDVLTVRVGTNRLAHDEVVGPIKDPRDITDAQFSATFSVALYLVKDGAGFGEYTEDNLHDPVVRELAERVILEIDDEIEAEFQRTRPRGAKVSITLRDGTVLTNTVERLRLLTPEDLDAKYRTLSRRVLTEARSEQLLTCVRHLEKVDDVGEVARLLCAA